MTNPRSIGVDESRSIGGVVVYAHATTIGVLATIDVIAEVMQHELGDLGADFVDVSLRCFRGGKRFASLVYFAILHGWVPGEEVFINEG